MAKTTITKILFRRGSDYDRKPTILDEGEPGWVTDTCRMFIGDGRSEGGFPALNIRTPENAPIHPYNNELMYEPIGDLTGTSQPPTQEVLAINHAGLSANITRDWADDRYVLRDPCETNSLINPVDTAACAPGSTIKPTQVMKANLVVEGESRLTGGLAISGGVNIDTGGLKVAGDSTFQGNTTTYGTISAPTATFDSLELGTPLLTSYGGTGDATGVKVANWDTAYTWGDHHQYSYLQEADLGGGLVRDPATGMVNLVFSPAAGLRVSPSGEITTGTQRRTTAPGVPSNADVPGAEYRYIFVIDGLSGTDTSGTNASPDSLVHLDQDFQTSEYAHQSFVAGHKVSPNGEGSSWFTILAAYDWAVRNAPGGSRITFLIRRNCHFNSPTDEKYMTNFRPDPKPKGDLRWLQFGHVDFGGWTDTASPWTDTGGSTHDYNSLPAVQARGRIQVNCGMIGLPLWFRGPIVDMSCVRLVYNYNNAGVTTNNGNITTQETGVSSLFRMGYKYCHWRDSSITVHPPVSDSNIAISMSPIQSQDNGTIYITGRCLFDLAGFQAYQNASEQTIWATDRGGDVVLGANRGVIMVNPPNHTNSNTKNTSYGLNAEWHYIGKYMSTSSDGLFANVVPDTGMSDPTGTRTARTDTSTYSGYIADWIGKDFGTVEEIAFDSSI